MNYEQSGVNVAAGEQAVSDIRAVVRRSYTPGVLSELGSFGGLFCLDADRYRQPVLVSSTDGVGTKLRVAIMADRYDTIGQCLVNHCVNDILVQGAEPLFFLDYIGLAKMDQAKIRSLIEGMTQACVENGCALIGGEMAEMPGIYHENDFDLVGTIVGVVDRDKIITGAKIRKGDLLIGLGSSGLHTNGYSLARAIAFDKLGLGVDSYIPELGSSLGEQLLSVHTSYLSVLRPFLKDPALHGMAHITGGGIPGNLKRIIPDGLCANLSYPMDEIPPLFKWLQNRGKVADDEMQKAFNLGIGMILAVDEASASKIMSATGGMVIGEIVNAKEPGIKTVFID